MVRRILTEALIARAFPTFPPDDPDAIPLMPQDAIDASHAQTFADVETAEDVWLFGYGSLMWNPDIAFAERRTARLRGWHRRFCLWQWRFRGSRERPGLMMALDRGGSCVGAAFRIVGPDAATKLGKTWRREMIGMAYRPIWVGLETTDGPVSAVTFVADRRSHRYAGRRSIAEEAALIAQACGHVGPSATYLLETWRHCEEIGIRDPMLRALQSKVAELLEENHR
jgi:glutathione-specific gamma-glutamylcyclotransferase